MNRRPLALATAWLAGVCVALAAPLAQAAAPMQKTSGPGYYRMMLGDFEITALSDGTIDLTVHELLTNTTPARVKGALAKQYLADPVETSVNAYLINTGQKLVMIDAGSGTLFGPTVGKLLANLRASGYDPSQVDEIYITHMHADHVGGLMTGSQLAFPNAIVRAEQKEADFWLNKAVMDSAPEDAKMFFKGAMMSINPYADVGRFKPFSGNTDLVPGIKAVVTRGHTPGHAMFVAESKGQKMAFWGDLMHVAAVQFPEPGVTIKFDTDSKTAAVQRKKEFADAAKQGYWIAASHLPFPGIGHLKAEGKSYRWVPANYSAMR